jgi:hypothetical protein
VHFDTSVKTDVGITDAMGTMCLEIVERRARQT